MDALRPLVPVLLVFAVLGALWAGFDRLLLERNQPNRGIAVGMDGAQRLVLEPGPGGHFRVPGAINGEPVDFLIDTGASHVAVPGHLADRLGLERQRPIRVRTAAGVVTAFDTTIEELMVGGITARRVGGSINPAMDMDAILLGMTFLREVDWSQRDGQLVIEARGA